MCQSESVESYFLFWPVLLSRETDVRAGDTEMDGGRGFLTKIPVCLEEPSAMRARFR